MRTIKIEDALSPECLELLNDFLQEVARDQRHNHQSEKDTVKLLKQRVLEPFRAELELTWDLDYLAYAICYSVQRQFGINMLG